MPLEWVPLTSLEQIETIVRESHQTPCLIYKHSTRCSISSLALRRLESDWQLQPEHIRLYFLDLIRFRAVSNAVAAQFGVHHASPQVLLIRDGVCVYDASHMSIRAGEVLEALDTSII